LPNTVSKFVVGVNSIENVQTSVLSADVL
jgi:hypothetical protein